MSEQDPNGLSAKEPGAKLDGGKSPVYRGAVQYFPRALRAIAQLSAFGAQKYSWGGWAAVPDGVDRYTDALVRHLTAESIEGDLDKDTNLPHSYATAWNAMARLELILREQKDKPTPPNVVEIPTPKVVDGPYCGKRGCGQSDCGELAKFRVDNGKHFLPYYFCGPCLEKQPQWCVNMATAMEKA